MIWMCDLPSENVIYFKIGGFLILAFFVIGHIRGRVVFRSSQVYRADDPLQYWFMQIMYLLLAAFFLYPVYFC